MNFSDMPPVSATRPASARTPGLRRTLVAATMLMPLAAGAGGFAPQAHAQPTGRAPAAAPVAAPQPVATSVVSQPSTNPAVTVLLERANFWRNQTQYDQALESLNRALALEPDNQDALALAGQIQADRGNRPAAEAALARLRKTAPDDPRADKIDQSIKIGPIPQEALTDARRLAREGRLPEAVDRYNRVFRGNPPPDRLAVEYYQTLAGTENGWEPARDGLARTVRQNPDDLRAQLAYAQVLTYRDGARGDGIARLATLARNPAVADSATQAWRQAVTWLPQDKSSIPALSAYLAAHPNDGDIAARIETAKNPPPDPNDPAATQRAGGFEELNKGRLDAAGTAFQTAINTNPNDADATGGLGIVRLRQRRFAEARTLLQRAISLDPANKGRWTPALNGVAQAEAGSRPNPAVALMQRGNYAAAEAELQRQTAGGGGDAGLRAMLADAQAQQNKLGEAEQSYRSALSRNPRYTPALLGLAGVLSQQGRRDEALGYLEQAEALGGGNRNLVAQARAQQLREQAAAISDPATQAGLYRSAVAADPSNPWIRLDYARALLKQGAVREARAVMAEAVAGKPSTDALKAGILFANESSDPDAAQALLARLPEQARTPDLRAIGTQTQLQREIARVIDLPHTTARSRLLALAAQQDPEGTRGATIARALASIGDVSAARRAILVARDATPNQGSAARIAYAGALLDIGDATGAQTMLAPLGYGGSLPPSQKATFTQLRAGLAIKTADDLNQVGKQAEGYDKLAPALASDPDNADMNLALARLYSGARNPREALEINEALLRRDPNNAEARRGAVAAALASGNRARARELVQEGLEIAPDDPKSWMASADVARASGNSAQDLRDLARARELRLQQLGYSDNGTDDSTLTHVTLAPGSAPITSRTAARVKVAALGSGQAPSATLPVYAGADLGQDAPDPLAVPPALSQAPRPTPLRPNSLAPASSSIEPPSSVFTSSPDTTPTPSAPSRLPTQGPAPRLPTQAPVAQPTYAQPTYTPQPAPARRVLDTTQTESLPAPRPAAQLSRANTAADSLNAQQLGGGYAPPPSAGYAAPPPAPTNTGAGQYVPPAYTAPTYRPQANPYAQPVYAGQPLPQSTAAAAPYATPTYVPTVQAGAAPTYPGYLPPVQQADAPYQTAPGSRYQPQVQEYLPQYRPAPPPVSTQQVLEDNAQFLRGGEFDKPYRPYLPKINGDETVPFGRSTADAGPTRYYDNPFRRSPDDNLQASAGLPPGNGLTGPDPVTQEIDRNIVSLRDTLAPSVQGGFGLRLRSGDAGLDKLSDVSVPLEATFSPGATGTVKLSVTPQVLTSGSIGGDDTNLQRFGTYALDLTPPNQSGGLDGKTYVPAALKTGYARPASQQAQGVGFDVQYANRYFTGDIGTTPIGFRFQNIVGGIELAPRISDRVTLRLTAERRALTDSILSYAGTVDNATGNKWGGVVSNHARVAVEFSAGPADFYVDGGGSQITGRHVANNSQYEFGGGGSYPIFKQGDEEIRVGADLFYESYSKNLRFFTYGQGGYFSPQSYVSALIPITYRAKVDQDLTYEHGAAIGLQSFTEKASNYYPDDPALQTALNAIPTFSGLTKVYPNRSSSGIAGDVKGKIDYRVSPNMHIGGAFSFQHSGDFDEAMGSVYARYVFNGTLNR